MEVKGTKQRPIEGVSFAYSFDDAKAKSRHTTQYFEMTGNRAIYHDGWMAATVHRTPFEPKPRATFENDVWELYNLDKDFSEATDLAALYPEKLKELQALFLAEAEKYNVLPLDDRTVERWDPKVAGRPDVIGSRKAITLYPGTPGIMENNFINVKNRSFTVDADIEIPKEGAEGVIFAQGGNFGGWSLYVKENKPKLAYNWVGQDLYVITSDTQLPEGKSKLRFEFIYDGGEKRGAGGKGLIFINGKQVAEGRIEKTVPNGFSSRENTDVGEDNASVVTNDYEKNDNKFTGTIEKVTIATK